MDARCVHFVGGEAGAGRTGDKLIFFVDYFCVKLRQSPGEKKEEQSGCVPTIT